MEDLCQVWIWHISFRISFSSRQTRLWLFHWVWRIWKMAAALEHLISSSVSCMWALFLRSSFMLARYLFFLSLSVSSWSVWSIPPCGEAWCSWWNLCSWVLDLPWVNDVNWWFQLWGRNVLKPDGCWSSHTGASFELRGGYYHNQTKHLIVLFR